MTTAPRVSVKIFGAEPDVSDSVFVPIFHDWIRDRALDLVLLDVADYSHVPDGPGIMLIAHSMSFALDRTDGRFGLRVQQRRPVDDDPAHVIAELIRQAFLVADRLEGDPRLRGRIAFDRRTVRVESNDRLRAPNTDAGWSTLAPLVRSAIGAADADGSVRVARVPRPRRERLAVEASVGDRPGMDVMMRMRDGPPGSA